MRVRARKDGNHAAIAKALVQYGCSVLDLSQLGGGVPDLLVAIHGRSMLMEVKDGSKPPSARKLTEDQSEFHATWRGATAIVSDIDSALRAARVLAFDGA